MADYVTRNSSGYDLSLKGPYVNEGVNMNLHVLNAELLPLWRTVKRYLNDPPGKGWYSPFGDRVLVSCTDVRKAWRRRDPRIDARGRSLVLHPRPLLQSVTHPDRVVRTVSLREQRVAMVTGREIHGFRKDLATSFATTDVDVPAGGIVPPTSTTSKRGRCANAGRRLGSNG
jgi:hypothetical protein